MDNLKEFNSILHSLDNSKTIYTIFEDFLSLSTYALAQPFYRSKELEQKYINIIQKYTKEQAVKFSQMLALVVNALDEKFQDFLGQVFSSNNFGNARKGQFFTPHSVSQLMSEINITDIEYKLQEYDVVTLAEPCCGSGGMIIAYAEALKTHGYNYQHQLFVEAIDIDETCFKMAFIQLSLLGIPARVMLGDSLAWKFKQVLYTPLYFVNRFETKLIKRVKTDQINNFETFEIKQLSLF